MKYVAVATPRYRLELPGYDWFEPPTTNSLNQVVDSIRTARLAGLPLVVTRAQLTVEQVAACTWCRARPRVVEQDCDGPYMTTMCGAPQCEDARRLAYEGVIAYPSYRRGDQALRLVKPVRVRRSDDPTPGAVTVDEYDQITCLCGNIFSFAGFHPCLAGGALVESREWTGLFWCGAVGCSGVIVDCRHLDDIQSKRDSVTNAFPVEIHDECADCSARWDAPLEDHHVDCCMRWD